MLPTTPEFLLNAGIQLLNAALLYAGLRRLGPGPQGAGIAALVVAVHPAQIPILAGPTLDVLAVSSWLVALWLEALRRTGRRATLVDVGLILVMAAGYFASASILLLPAGLLAVDAAAPGRGEWRKRVLEKTPLIAAALLGAVYRMLTAGPADPLAASLTLPDRAATAAAALARAFATLGGFLPPTPFPAAPGADAVPAAALLAATVWILALGLVAWRFRSARPGLAWCGLLLLVVALGAVRQPFAAFAPELVVAGAGAAWAFAGILPRAPLRRAILAAPVLLALGASSARELPYWTDETRLLHRTVENQPAHWTAEARLARRLAEEGEPDEAITRFAAALVEQPRFAWAQVGLADALESAGRTDDARLVYENVLQTGWSDPGAGPRLGFVFLRIGLDEPAAALLRRGLSRSPGDPDLQAGLALALARLGQAGARTHLDAALEAGLRGVDARFCAAWLLATDPGLRDPVRALGLVRPDDPARLQDAAAAALAALGRAADAFATAQAAAAALERDGWPGYAADVRDRARVYLQGGTWTEPRGSGPGVRGEVHD